MKELIKGFSDQLRKAIEIGEKAVIKASTKNIQNVVITGLGGSGIGGKIVAQLVEKELSLPLVTNNNYGLPNFVNEYTLVIVCSYSGNTEETVEAMKLGIEKGAEICCVTTGGLVGELANQHQLNCITIPAGSPPRAALGYSLIQLFYILNEYGIITSNHKNELETATQLIDEKEDEIVTEAKGVASKLEGKTTAIYADALFEGVAIRFRQQINENSKELCWHHVLPEMNHNELVGWAGGSDNTAVVLFRNKTDFNRVQTRMEISKEIFSNYTSTVIEIWSQGDSDIERAIYLIHLGDWISSELADIKSIDAVEVNVIDHLKGELAKK